jgi:3'(2'), 5'-bisphosphate nucleotidase
LDGTKEFIKRNGEFTVNIALVENGMPILGVVYTPVTEELFYAVKGSGAYRSHQGEETKLSVNKFSKTDAGLRLVCSRSHLNEETQTFVDQYTTPDLVSKGSSLKFMILAMGQADIYPRLAPTMEWDTCAAQIILEEAGGQVINNETKQPVHYNKENLLNPHFIAMGGLQEDSL